MVSRVADLPVPRPPIRQLRLLLKWIPISSRKLPATTCIPTIRVSLRSLLSPGSLIPFVSSPSNFVEPLGVRRLYPNRKPESAGINVLKPKKTCPLIRRKVFYGPAHGQSPKTETLAHVLARWAMAFQGYLPPLSRTVLPEATGVQHPREWPESSLHSHCSP